MNTSVSPQDHYLGDVELPFHSVSGPDPTC